MAAELAVAEHQAAVEALGETVGPDCALIESRGLLPPAGLLPVVSQLTRVAQDLVAQPFPRRSGADIIVLPGHERTTVDGEQSLCQRGDGFIGRWNGCLGVGAADKAAIPAGE